MMSNLMALSLENLCESNFKKVKEFHKAFNIAVNEDITVEQLDLRQKLIAEEFKEVTTEINMLKLFPTSKSYKEDLLGELCDLLYVVYGTAVSFGLDIDKAFARVHIANMSKLGEDGKPIYREDGKVLKSKNFTKAYLGDLV